MSVPEGGLFGLAGMWFGEGTLPPETPPVTPPTPVATSTDVFITVRASRCVHATPTMAMKRNRVIVA